MSSSPEVVVVKATAAVFVGGRRAGSAVLVDGRHLLTAAHVLLHREESGRRVLAEEVELVFPAVLPGGGEREARTLARRILPQDVDEPSVDVAVLDLGRSRRPGYRLRCCSRRSSDCRVR